MLVGAGLPGTVCFCQALKGPKACAQQLAFANATSADGSIAAMCVQECVPVSAKKLASCSFQLVSSCVCLQF